MPKTQIRTSQIKSQKVKFNDLHNSVRLIIVVISVGVLGILTLQLSGAAPLSLRDRFQLFNGGNRRFYIPPANSGLPQSTGGTSSPSTTCQNSQGSTVVTGDATSSGGGTANTGGNVACGN